MFKRKWESVPYRTSRTISDEIADYLESEGVRNEEGVLKLLNLNEELVSSLKFELWIAKQKME